MSTPPKVEAAASTIRWTSARTATSPTIAVAVAPSCAISSTTAVSFDSVRPLMATLAPRSASTSAMARPIPCPAPVTSAVLPASSTFLQLLDQRPESVADRLHVPHRDIFRSPADRSPDEDGLDRCASGGRGNLFGDRLRGPVRERRQWRCVDVAGPELLGVHRPRRGRVGALHHVLPVRVDLVREMLGHDGPITFGILGDERLEAAGHASDRRIVTALDEPGSVELPESAVGQQQAGAQHAGPARPLRSLVPHPDRERILHRWRHHAVVAEPPPNLTGHPVGRGVTMPEVGTEELELRDAVPGPEPEVDAATRHDVDQCRLLGDLDRMVERRDHDRSTEPDPPGTRRDRGEEREWLRDVPVVEEVVLGRPHRMRAETLRFLAQLERESVQA